ncbi:MAG: dUTP diphosphatase [bacterium]
MPKVPVNILKLDLSVPTPEYKTSGAVGFDIAIREAVDIPPGENRIIPTGMVICVPEGYVLMIASRSSNAKKNLMLGNGVGIIDPDYCGPNDELRLAVRNMGPETYRAEKHERLAQGLFIPVAHAAFSEVEKLENPDRGGFGTTR